MLTGTEMLWNFFCSGHGKGEHDGAGAVIKRALTEEQLKTDGVPTKCAADVVAFLRLKYSSSKREGRVFWEIKEGEVDRNIRWDCEAIHKSRSIHSDNGYNSCNCRSLRFKLLSCFCILCLQGAWISCTNKAYVGN